VSEKDRSIQREFLDGMNEVFTSIFNNEVMLYLMDEENTVVNKLYGETADKVYKEPIALAAKIVTKFKKDELPEMTVNIDAVITVPTKQLMINNVPRDTMQDLLTLTKGKISYKQVIVYMIELVRPKVLIDDEWQFYDFYCYVPKGENV
jgi:hypothetical protein